MAPQAFPSHPFETAMALRSTAPSSWSAVTIDIEQLLVRQGWLCLRSRVVGCVQEIAICTSKQATGAVMHLAPREFQVAALAARGLMAKEIGFELAITEATARGTLGRALLKLGIDSGVRLVAVWNALSRPARSFDLGPDQTALVFACDLALCNAGVGLTSTERVILAGILGGCSNRDISDQRGTSRRTVANQVSRILRKFRVSTRRQLSARIFAANAALLGDCRHAIEA